MKKKIITVFAIAAFIMGGTLIAPNSSDSTVKADNFEKMLPSFEYDYENDKTGCPKLGHGCD